MTTLKTNIAGGDSRVPTLSLKRILFVDGLLIAAMCLVPAMSHAFSLPLYKLNPMLLCLLAGMVMVSDWRNALLLGVLLPVVSMLVVGMPTPSTALCMVAELVSVVAVFHLTERRMPTFVSLFGAMVFGKIMYYGMKALVVGPSVLITTNPWIQLASMLVFCTLFAVIYRKR